MGEQQKLDFNSAATSTVLEPIHQVSPAQYDSISAAFEAFHARNPQVYTLLVELARQVKKRGKRTGIGALFERLRWEYLLRTEGEEFKLNNNYRSRYARLIDSQEMDLVEFFDMRELRSE